MKQSTYWVLGIGVLGILILITTMTQQFLSHPLISQLQSVKESINRRYPAIENISVKFRQRNKEFSTSGLIISYTHQQKEATSLEYEMDQLAKFTWENLGTEKPSFPKKESKKKKNKQTKNRKGLKSRIQYILVKNQEKEKEYSIEKLNSLTSATFNVIPNTKLIPNKKTFQSASKEHK